MLRLTVAIDKVKQIHFVSQASYQRRVPAGGVILVLMMLMMFLMMVMRRIDVDDGEEVGRW